MNKKGIGISFEALVVAIIVLVVLFVVVAIFITQSGKYVDKYSDVADQAEDQAKGCNIMFGRHCAPCAFGEREIQGEFEECGGGACCEKIQQPKK